MAVEFTKGVYSFSGFEDIEMTCEKSMQRTEMCTGHILEKAAEDDRAFVVSLRKVGW